LILVDRGPEPPALTAARTVRLADAVAAYNAHGAPSEQLSNELNGYDAMEVKKTLHESQHKKCAWCEIRSHFSSSPIEHYRPKNGAWRNLRGVKKQVSAGHYWWLTWSWHNLFFSCPRCNDHGHKGSYFPLRSGASEVSAPARPIIGELPAAAFDMSAEQPMLLDPAVDTFLDHIEWVPSNTSLARRLWTWTPRAHTERGQATIDLLKLAELADELQHHLVSHVLPLVEEVERHIDGRRTLQAADSWKKVLDLLAPTQSLTAATWCALKYLVDETWLFEWKLAPIPRPR
jgi:uncharacterized protein (TIGR02646 family)